MKRKFQYKYLYKILVICLALIVASAPVLAQETALPTEVITSAPTDTPKPAEAATPKVLSTESQKPSETEKISNDPPEVDATATATPKAQVENTTQATEPLESAKAVEPTDAVEPTSVADPADPVKPTDVVEPTDAVDPTPDNPSTSPETSVTPPIEELPSEPPMESVSPSAPSNAINIIMAFAPLSMSYNEMSVKPTLEDALSKLPGTLQATFADATMGEVPVLWSCPDYESRVDGEFVFSTSLVSAEYQLGENVVMPQFTLKIIAEFVLSDSNYQGQLNDEGELVITAWLGSGTELTVPEKIDGYVVAEIAAEVFLNNVALERVELPKGLKKLGDRMFAGCAKLETVVLPDSLEAVGAELFKDCEALKFVILRTDLNSTLTGAGSIAHDVVDEGTFSVQLPVAFTDIQVNAGKFIMDCNFSVAAEHSITISGSGAMHVATGRTLTNLGTIANSGVLTSAGTILNCAGSFSGTAVENQEGGVYTTEHAWADDVCTVCGAKNQTEIEIKPLTIEYVGDSLSKTYDKTRNVKLKASDFSIKGIREGHEVSIATIQAAYDGSSAGNRTVKASFTLGGSSAAYYTVTDFSISAKITPKKLTITPSPDQSKTFGAANPTYYTGKVKGLLSGDTLSGRLSRAEGEDAGQYKIVQGTISGGSNYEVHVAEVFYTIKPKSINSSDVAMVSIGNQRYTGSGVMPTVSMRFGDDSLEEGLDYTVNYSNNVQPGTATVRIYGINNFSSERSATFRILRVSSGIDYTGDGFGGETESGSGTTNYGTDGFYADPEGDAAVSGDYYGNGGNLMLNDMEYGTILFNELDEPRSFVQVEEKIEGAQTDQWRLRIQAEPETSDFTGEILYLADGREQYGQAYLRLSIDLVQSLIDAGFAEIVFEVETAQLTVPLAALLGDIQLDAEQLIQVETYDICIDQLQPQAMTQRETTALNGYTQISSPYRVSIMVENSQVDAQGYEIVEDYAVLGLLEGIQLRLMPDDEIDDSVESVLIWASDDAELPEEEAVDYSEAIFAEDDYAVYGATQPLANGLYCYAQGNVQ